MKNSRIAYNIKRLRKERGLSQEKLAEYSGVSALTIVRIENEQVTPIFVTLNAIALTLGTNIEELEK